MMTLESLRSIEGKLTAIGCEVFDVDEGPSDS